MEGVVHARRAVPEGNKTARQLRKKRVSSRLCVWIQLAQPHQGRCHSHGGGAWEPWAGINSGKAVPANLGFTHR